MAKKKSEPQSLLATVRQFFWIILICAMVVIPLAVWGTGKLKDVFAANPYPMQAVGMEPGAKINREFTLTDQNGHGVTGNEYSSRSWAVFFGYTHCPDVCPLTLSRLSSVWPEIKNQERIQLFFISVDPERDTPDVLKDYMKAFNPGFIALTGESVKIEQMKKDFHVYSSKVQEKGDPNYTVDHSASVILLRSDGTLAGTIDTDETDAIIIGKLKALTGG